METGGRHPRYVDRTTSFAPWSLLALRRIRGRPSRSLTMNGPVGSRVGISAIAVHEPAWSLANDWFGDTLPRKFSHHTGINSRFIADEDEVQLGTNAVRKLQADTGCDLSDCAALMFVCPSFVRMPSSLQDGDQHSSPPRIRTLGRQLASQLGLSCRVASINWYCSGYTRALALVLNRWLPRLMLRPDQFVLIVTATRISQITDYSCNQTGGLFGDLATATLLAPTGSRKYPVRFELLYASAEKQPTPDVYFNYQMRSNVLAPTADGGQRTDAERLVFSLDCMGIADTAPRAMASALAKAMEGTGKSAGDIGTVLPHQAGAGITRLTAMKIEELGVHCDVINGLTECVGNVSSSSIAYGLAQHWSQLSGIIACPAAGVGSPGRPEVSQGCILLRTIPA